MTSYQYAILRYRQNAMSDERVNIGVVLWIPSERRLLWSVTDYYRRLSVFFKGDFDGQTYRQMIRHLRSRLQRESSRVASSVQLAIGEPRSNVMRSPRTDSVTREDRSGFGQILRAILPDPDSSFQWSVVMSGRHARPDTRLDALFQEFVLKYDERVIRPRRDDDAIGDAIDNRLRNRHLVERLESAVVVRGEHDYQWVFRRGWHNGMRQVMQPISFDYEQAYDVVEKATHWRGRLITLAQASQFQMTGVVAPPSDPSLTDSYHRALAILSSQPNVRKLVPENELDDFLPEIERDLSH